MRNALKEHSLRLNVRALLHCQGTHELSQALWSGISKKNKKYWECNKSVTLLLPCSGHGKAAPGTLPL